MGENITWYRLNTALLSNSKKMFSTVMINVSYDDKSLLLLNIPGNQNTDLS